MDFTIQKSIFLSNLKHWSFHTVINSLPSIMFAYIHDWNTTECMIAMGLGIILFALMWSFFMSMHDVDKFCNSDFMTSALKAGLKLRLILIGLSIPFIISFLVYLYSGEHGLMLFSESIGLICAPDLILGIFSHAFYGELREIIPISGVHHFFPTIVITLIQGFLLMTALIVSGILLVAIGLGIKQNKTLRGTPYNP